MSCTSVDMSMMSWSAVKACRSLSLPSAGQHRRKEKKEQKLVLNETTDKDYCTVNYVLCTGCVAGGDGGLCSNVFALLEAQF